MDTATPGKLTKPQTSTSANSSTGEKSWKLSRYAYFTGSAAGGSDAEKDKWKFYDGSKQFLNLLITTSCHLVVMAGPTVQESYSLVTSGSFMKGVSKGDSLLLVCKFKGEARRFRAKFHGGEQVGATCCSQAVACLKKYFPIRCLENSDEKKNEKQIELQGDVSLPTLAEMALGDLSVTLPLAYNECQIPTSEINTLVRLCLSDASFPAFVGQVHRELLSITEDEIS